MMAASYAGVKRSYHDMTGRSMSPTALGPGLSSTPTPARTETSTPDAIKAAKATVRNQVFGPVPRRGPFDPSASIILIGFRGVGKRTLAVLAATAYNRRVKDTERAFQEIVGTTSNIYRAERSHQEYREKRTEVLRQLLKDSDTGRVIICNFTDLEGESINLVREFSRTHPVIHVVRDAAGIHQHLRSLSAERIDELLLASSSRIRACSNYEFYNRSEPLPEPSNHSPPRSLDTEYQNDEHPGGRTLVLKRVERDFLRLLRNIIGSDRRGSAHHYPLSQVALDQRSHTLAVRITVAEVLAGADVESMQVGADCIELVYDSADEKTQSAFHKISVAFSTVRRATILPILLNVRRRDLAQGRSDSKVFELTKFCLTLSPELCTFDLSLPDEYLKPLLACKGACAPLGVLEIVDRPLRGWRDSFCFEQFRRAAYRGCSSFRITMPTVGVEDVFEINRFRHHEAVLNHGTLLAAYSTGPQGMLSRCFNDFLTVVYPQQHTQTSPAGIELQHSSTAKDHTRALFATSIFEPLRFFVFGADVSYSVSPAMHNAAYEACGMQYSYEARSSDSIEELKSIFQQADFGGASVAQPYKTTMVPLLDGLSPHAKIIGAINTVIPLRELNPDGSVPDDVAVITRRHQQGPVKAIYGFNTDWIGIRACVRRGLSPANSVRAPSTAVVCGAGGMARSAVYSLLSLGVKNIYVCNRTIDHASALADHYNKLIGADRIPNLDPGSNDRPRVHVLSLLSSPWPNGVKQPTMIISGIPRQEAGQPPVNFSLPDEWLQSGTGGIVLELAYRQGVSPLAGQIRAKAQQGWIFMDGIDMLPEQAFAQFELFTGRRAPRGVMKDEIMKDRPIDEN